MAVITPETIVVGVSPQDITAEKFQAILADGSSPALDAAVASYSVLSTIKVSIAFATAVFNHESRLGRLGICKDYDTMSPGNTRSTRTGQGVVFNVPNRGPFCKYPSWEAGFQDLSFRLVDPNFSYAKEGRVTIKDVIHRYAPASDNNVPDQYVNAVVADMNKWIGDAPMAGDIPGVAFVPADSRHFTEGRAGVLWPDRYIFHHTNGYDSLGWLTTSPNSDVSATYLHNRDGTVRAQLVRHKDTPHTTGNWNRTSLSSEWERKWPEQREIPDTTYANLGQHLAAVVRAERQRGNPHFSGPLRRDQVSDHNDYYDTVCPGNLDVGTIYQIAANALQGGQVPPPPEQQLFIPGNPYGEVPLIAGFRDYVTAAADARYPADLSTGILSIYGYPEQAEYKTSFGSCQIFQRALLLWFRDTASPWDIVPGLRGEPLPEQVE